jgi:hypothetical protein
MSSELLLVPPNRRIGSSLDVGNTVLRWIQMCRHAQHFRQLYLGIRMNLIESYISVHRVVM